MRPAKDSDWPAQSICCALRTQPFFMQKAKALIRLGGCSGWSESSLGRCPGWSESSLGTQVIFGGFVMLLLKISKFLSTIKSISIRATQLPRTVQTDRENEPWHDKTYKMHGAKRRLWSAWASAQSDQSSMCAQWIANDPRFLHADSKVSDQTGQMPRLIDLNLRWAHTHFVGFVMSRLKWH